MLIGAPRPFRRVGAILLIATFLPGLAGEAYGPHSSELAVRGPAVALHPVEPPDPEGIPNPPPRRPHDPLRCTCIGTCHGAAATPHPATPTALDTTAMVPYLRAAEAPAEDHLPARPPFLLPYATGPPAA